MQLNSQLHQLDMYEYIISQLMYYCWLLFSLQLHIFSIILCLRWFLNDRMVFQFFSLVANKNHAAHLMKQKTMAS